MATHKHSPMNSSLSFDYSFFLPGINSLWFIFSWVRRVCIDHHFSPDPQCTVYSIFRFTCRKCRIFQIHRHQTTKPSRLDGKIWAYLWFMLLGTRLIFLDQGLFINRGVSRWWRFWYSTYYWPSMLSKRNLSSQDHGC